MGKREKDETNAIRRWKRRLKLLGEDPVGYCGEISPKHVIDDLALEGGELGFDFWKVGQKIWTKLQMNNLKVMYKTDQVVQRKLDPYEQWMVKSNLETIQSGVPMADQVAILKANGYPRVAAAVEKAWNEQAAKK